MKKTFLIIAALAALSIAAFGAHAQDPKAVAPDLTVEQAVRISAGLQQLNKYDTVDKDGKATTTYYKFSGDLRILIALNLDIVSRVETAYQKASNELIMGLAVGGSGKVPEDKMGEFHVTSRKMLDAPCRCTLYKIKMTDLKLDENPIPAQVLSLVIPIIDR